MDVFFMIFGGAFLGALTATLLVAALGLWIGG